MPTIMFRGGTYEIIESIERVRVPWQWSTPPWKVFSRRKITRWRSHEKTLETWQEVATRIEATAKLAEVRACLLASIACALASDRSLDSRYRVG